ncbi:carbohydrate ABC transporter permease [Paenibacillus sp. JSM ZJ436]|uniref:carbohydrate ABC transporter permease n=1 Tax=Paenibacillus sp. JSM ZJ436 TaxID=3376190 RepID=UPI0037A41283
MQMNERSLVKLKNKKMMWCYLFILPQLLLYLAFTIYPMIMSYVYSFFEWDGLGPLENFIGVENFVEILSDSYFWNAFRNSFVFMFGIVVIQVPLALLMALLLNAKWLKGASFYRLLIFLPVVTTTAVVGVVMRFIFGAYKGLVNEVLLSLGIINQAIDWLGSTDTAFIVVLLVGIWKTFGMKMIYWLAGLQSLPQDLYEAAKVDGASIVQSFRHITIPLLIPIGTVIMLLSAVNALHVFDLVQTMTGGGPAFATDMVDVYVYRYAFAAEDGVARIGFASAAGILYGVAVFLVSLVMGLFVKFTGGKSKKSIG